MPRVSSATVTSATSRGDHVMALCKIHHAAYDQDFLGVSPDYVFHINERLLADRDGPMLQFGLQAMNGKTLELPSRRDDRPDRDYLAERFARFVA